MTYEKALEQAKKTGAGKAEGLPLLAMTCKALSLAHAVNPRLAYQRAKRLNLDAKSYRTKPLAVGHKFFENHEFRQHAGVLSGSSNEVRRLDPIALGDLMFV